MKHSFIKLLVLIILLIPFSSELRASSLDYSSFMNSTSFSNVISSTASGISITSHGISKTDGEKIIEIATNSMLLLPEFYKINSRCRSLDLNIYQVDYSTLNNRDIMSFLDWTAWENRNIDAIYDSRAAPSGTSAIFIMSNISDYKLKKLISHEIAHFWQHTQCHQQSESLATEFELFFRSSELN